LFAGVEVPSRYYHHSPAAYFEVAGLVCLCGSLVNASGSAGVLEPGVNVDGGGGSREGKCILSSGGWRVGGMYAGRVAVLLAAVGIFA